MTRGDIVGLIGIVALLALMALRMPIGIAMLLVGIVGFGYLNGFQPALAALATYPYAYAAVYDFAVIPLFVLMGNLGSVSGMARDLYTAAYAWIGHWRGGLAHATILACAGFAAVSGSSVASAVTMGKVCLPEMRRYKYDHRLSTGTIAAGGTLGILIPPSTAFVIYGLLTEQSIGKLLLAGILPGLLLTGIFMITVAIWMRFRPHYGPPGPRAELARAAPERTGRRPDDAGCARQHRRHLSRRLHAGGSGGRWRGARLPLRPVAPLARRRQPRRDPGRLRAHHRAGVPDPDRRPGVRPVPGALRPAREHRQDAGRPGGAPPRHPDHHPFRLHRARHLPRGLLDAGADPADRDPDHPGAGLRPDLVRRRSW